MVSLMPLTIYALLVAAWINGIHTPNEYAITSITVALCQNILQCSSGSLWISASLIGFPIFHLHRQNFCEIALFLFSVCFNHVCMLHQFSCNASFHIFFVFSDMRRSEFYVSHREKVRFLLVANANAKKKKCGKNHQPSASAIWIWFYFLLEVAIRKIRNKCWTYVRIEFCMTSSAHAIDTSICVL